MRLFLSAFRSDGHFECVRVESSVELALPNSVGVLRNGDLP
jgi:hypothetical protein